MSRKIPGRSRQITDRFIRTVCARLAANKRVRRNLPVWGRLHIDRQLPFLVVYRRPTDRSDPGTERLASSEASYLIASGRRGLGGGLGKLVQAVVETLSKPFGAFLLVELWSGDLPDAPPDSDDGIPTPGFRLIAPRGSEADGLIDTFGDVLAQIRISRRSATVGVERTSRWGPARMSPILRVTSANQMGCCVLGLEVNPIYQDRTGEKTYPLVLREFRRRMTRALRRGFYEFARAYTTHRPLHYHMLGRRAMVKAVWEVDRRLAEVSDRFDYLLQVTPTNVESAWHAFQRSRFERAPLFRYRPLPIDPVVLKRRLYEAPVERTEDPTLLQLFRQKQDELDRRITMLQDINTPRFVHSSIQLFGDVDDELSDLAGQLLEQIPSRTRDDSRGGHLDAATFARRAEEEVEYYRQRWPEVHATVQLRPDMGAGLLVSHGSLLINAYARIPAARAEALIQHEIGTHMVTYYNGRAQPFRQLYSGLAGYEALQEGLAVVAEYLVDGLSRPRLRVLAARVLAIRHMIDGASFVETFRELDRVHDFDRRTAFVTTMRIYRGGGLTKDAVYLRGLCQLLEYLGRGGHVEPLLVGKIAAEHVPIIRELQWRRVLREPPLRPRYLEHSAAAARLGKLREGITVLDLIKGRHP
jgi:uncharacterized protein (TIGR02421 family)